MKYTTEVTLELPRERVIELFDSAENLLQWQEGLKSFVHISGEPGQEGAVSRLIYNSRRGELQMTETITRRNLPDEFHGIYEARGVYNEIYNYFVQTGTDQTAWKSTTIFRFKGLMALMAPFMKAAFVKNTLLNMERFKIFAENYKVQNLTQL